MEAETGLITSVIKAGGAPEMTNTVIMGKFAPWNGNW